MQYINININQYWDIYINIGTTSVLVQVLCTARVLPRDTVLWSYYTVVNVKILQHFGFRPIYHLHLYSTYGFTVPVIRTSYIAIATRLTTRYYEI
jgi:hypothetical protein